MDIKELMDILKQKRKTEWKNLNSKLNLIKLVEWYLKENNYSFNITNIDSNYFRFDIHGVGSFCIHFMKAFNKVAMYIKEV